MRLLEASASITIGEINYLWNSSSVLGSPEDTNKMRFLPKGHRCKIRDAQSSDTHPQLVINDHAHKGLWLWLCGLFYFF